MSTDLKRFEVVRHYTKKVFTLFWDNGKSEPIEGVTIGQALTLAGIKSKQLDNIVFYKEGKPTQYKWNIKEKKWDGYIPKPSICF